MTSAAHITVINTLPTSTTARDAVFDIPELLEAIIRRLPPRGILTKAQLVSKTWKDAIAQSPTIQARLWLRSQASMVAAPFKYTALTPQSEDNGLDCVPIYAGNVAHNRLFADAEYVRSIGTSWICADYYAPTTAGGLSEIYSGRRVALCVPEMPRNTSLPAWSNMYLTEPRITTAQMEFQVSAALLGASLSKLDPDWYIYTTVSLKDSDGLTFKAALAVAARIRTQIPQTLLRNHKTRVIVYFQTERPEWLD